MSEEIRNALGASEAVPLNEQIRRLITERDALKADRERWADSACRLEKAQEKLQAEIARLRGALEGMMKAYRVDLEQERSCKPSKEADPEYSKAKEALAFPKDTTERK